MVNMMILHLIGKVNYSSEWLSIKIKEEQSSSSSVSYCNDIHEECEAESKKKKLTSYTSTRKKLRHVQTQ